MEHLRHTVFGQTIAVRYLIEKDIETIVDYLHASDPDFLSSLGADLSKLTSRDATRQRLQSSLSNGPQRSRAYFVIASGASILGYTNLNFRSADEACAH